MELHYLPKPFFSRNKVKYSYEYNMDKDIFFSGTAW